MWYIPLYTKRGNNVVTKSYLRQLAAIKRSAAVLRQAEQAADRRMWEKRVAAAKAGKPLPVKL
jgi:hypothetical protein